MQIAVVLPYYGSLPKWMPLFLKTTETNPGVHFFIVTQEAVTLNLPQNVSNVIMPLGEIERRVRNAISPEFRIFYGYKLCDLKPFYGLVFEELVRGYDFWGYCDLDMVFGDLSSLLCAGRLEEADFFSADAGPVVGTFSLFRNNASMNSFALQIPGCIELLNSRDYQSLDEIAMTELLEQASEVRYVRPERLCQSQFSITSAGAMVGRTSGVVGEPNQFYWSDGHTFIKSPGHPPQEVMYLHFIGLKRSYHWSLYDPTVDYREFAFSAAGFQPWKIPPTPAAALERKCRGLVLKAATRGRDQVASRISAQNRHKLKAWLSKAGF